MTGQPSQAHLDVLARQMGFHDYATYSAYQQHQTARRLDNGIQGTGYSTGTQQPSQQPAAPTNWLQSLIQNYTPLGYVAKRFGQAVK